MGTKSFIDFILSGVYCQCFINKAHANRPELAKCLAALVYFPICRLATESNADLEFPTRSQHGVDIIFNHQELWARLSQFHSPDDLCIAEGQRFAPDRLNLKYCHLATGHWVIRYDNEDMVALLKGADADGRTWERLDGRYDKKILEHIALSKIGDRDTVESAMNGFVLPHRVRGGRFRKMTSTEYYEALLMYVLTNAREFRSTCLGTGLDKTRIAEIIIQDAMIKHFTAR